jgi:hypothetical protein
MARMAESTGGAGQLFDRSNGLAFDRVPPHLNCVASRAIL